MSRVYIRHTHTQRNTQRQPHVQLTNWKCRKLGQTATASCMWKSKTPVRRKVTNKRERERERVIGYARLRLWSGKCRKHSIKLGIFSENKNQASLLLSLQQIKCNPIQLSARHLQGIFAPQQYTNRYTDSLACLPPTPSPTSFPF